MRNKAKDEAVIAEKQKRILEVGFELFSKNGIEAITMPQIAEASGVGRASLYRYYSNKTELVVAISAWSWENMTTIMYGKMKPEGKTAAEELDYFMQSFIDMYEAHSDILRFNQFFNVFIATHGVKPQEIGPFTEVIEELGKLFHSAYEKGKVDGTVRSDIAERDMFEAILHLMLAVATRYAVGLVYGESEEAKKELMLLKSLLLDRYTRREC